MCVARPFGTYAVADTRFRLLKTGFFQITGEKDDVVPKNSDGSAKYAIVPAIEDVIAYYAEANGLTLDQIETLFERKKENG